MIKKILLTFTLFSMLLITVACSTANAQKQENQVPATQEISITDTGEFNQNPHITKQIEIAKDSHVIITLISNGSTGFTWNENAAISDSDILEQIQHNNKEAGSDKIGAPGTEQWTLKALKQGTATIKLDYSRPWEGGEKGIWTLELTVTVK
jgi:inhibitor of cysteine peptidase